MRERIQAMKQIWTQSTAAFDGEFVKFEHMMQWPKPVQKPYPPIVVGGAFPHAARRDRLRRRLDPIGGRVDPLEGAAAIPSNGKGRWPRSRVALLRRLRGSPET